MLHVSISGPTGGQLVVLCHGVTDSAASLADLVERLNPTYRVAAIDTLGHGLSPRLSPAQALDPMGACLDALAETVEDLVDSYGPAIGIGHSMGGSLLTRLASIKPSLFAGVVAEDPSWLDEAAQSKYKNWGRDSAIYMDKIAADPIAILNQNVRDYPTWPDRERLPWLQAKLDVDHALFEVGEVGYVSPWTSWAAGLEVPTLIVTSDQDCIIDEKGIERIEAMNNEHITCLLIPGTPHCVRRHDASAFQLAITPYLEAWSHA